MKKIILISFCLVIASHLTKAQSWEWSKKITNSVLFGWFGKSRGLITDKNGNVFSYGANSVYSTDTVGSYLQCYSNNGIQLFSKQWKNPFFIQKMEYDGNNNLYFAGLFYGTHTLDGITIVSHGGTDAVIGKMDLVGNVIWMKTFGGSGWDGAYGMCLNRNDSSIYVTGRIKDTLFFNNSFQSIFPQSAIICHYTSGGNLMNYKLYDFPSQQLMNPNCGVEICRNQFGAMFVLMDRNGDRWSHEDSGSGPVAGRYVFKLNSNLDILWSTFINGNESYYGWDCNTLKVTSNGDVYLIDYLGGKYGGMALLLRLNGNTGNISWSLGNVDGAYTDIFIDSNTVYLLGNEGASQYPDEYATPGYFVIKKIDENNTVIGETRIAPNNLFNLTKDVSGNIFITGRFRAKASVIGHDTILADSVYYNIGYQYYGKFLSKLNDINCTPPIVSVSVLKNEYSDYYPICPGDTVVLTVRPTTGSFIWSNGNTGLQTNIESTGNYFVTNLQPNGCIAYSLPVSVFKDTPIVITARATDTATFVNVNTDLLIGTPAGGTFSGTGVSGSNFNPSAAGIGIWPITYKYTTENGCPYTSTTNITVNPAPPTPLTLFETHTNILCKGQCTGTVSLNAIGGKPPYSFSGATNELCAGSYTFVVTDSNGLTTTTSATLSEPTAIISNALTPDSALCLGSCTDLNINTSGGTPGYSYLWMPGNLTSVSPNICPAQTTTYTCKVTDANACEQNSMVTVTINHLPIVTASAADSLTFINVNTDLLTGTPAGGTFSGTGVSGNNFNPSVAGIGIWPITYTFITEKGCTSTSTINITVNVLTSATSSGVEDSEIEVYPNPNFGIFTFNLKNKNSETKIKVYDVLGNCLFEKVSTKSSKENIDLTGQPKGVYNLEIESEGKIAMKKIVLQ